MKFPYNLDYSKQLVIDTSKRSLEPSELPGLSAYRSKEKALKWASRRVL